MNNKELKATVSRLEKRIDELSSGVQTNATPDESAPLTTVLRQSIEALNQANKQLEKAYAKDEVLKNLPYRYVIPEMEIDVKMTFSYVKGKGLIASLFKKGSESTEMVSNVRLVAKAVPGKAMETSLLSSEED